MNQADSPITYEQRGDVAVITMDDGKANALSYAMLDALDAALARAEREASALVLAGRERRFSAGFDLTVMMTGPQAARDLMLRGGDVMMRLYGCPLPTVAAVTGHALAGGMLLVLCCDTRIGAAGPFKLGLNEVQIGLPVPTLAYRLARDRIDPREVYAATLQAKIYDGEGAAVVGYLDRAVPLETVVDEAVSAAARLAALPATAYAFTKKSMREPIIAEIRASIVANLEALSALAES